MRLRGGVRQYEKPSYKGFCGLSVDLPEITLEVTRNGRMLGLFASVGSHTWLDLALYRPPFTDPEDEA